MRWRALLVSVLVGADACKDGPSAVRGPESAGPVGAVAATVVVDPVAAELSVGSSIQFAAIVRDWRGQKLLGAPVNWSSSNSNVATIDRNGLAKARSQGSITITARSGDAVGTAPLTVNANSSDGLEWAAVLQAEGIAPLYAVWGTSASDIFAVGTTKLWDCCAVVMHYDGSAWRYMDVPKDYELMDVWGSSSTNVFAVGNGVLHYDGNTWTPMPSAPRHAFEGVWGSSAADVFAVGGNVAVISHYDGQSWTDMSVPTSVDWLTDVWGSSSRDVFAVGQGGAVLHYDGQSWNAMVSPTRWQLNSVWGSSEHDVYAVGYNGTVMHYDGLNWRIVAGGLTDQELLEVWGSSHSDVFAVGTKDLYPNCCAVLLHFDGSRWSVRELPTGLPMWGLWGSSPDNVFLVGSGPTILHGTRDQAAR